MKLLKHNACGLFLLIAMVSGIPASIGAQAAPAPNAAPETPNQPSTTSQEVHLLVGHSIVLHTDSRLKRVLVGNPAVLTTATTSPNELVVTAIAPGASSILLWQKNVLQVLAEPNLMAVSGTPAKFLAGGELPYPVVTGGAAGSLGTVTIQFKPYGVKLEFTGEVEKDRVIKLTVAPEVSSLDYGNSVTVSGFVLPAISTRRAETVVQRRRNARPRRL